MIADASNATGMTAPTIASGMTAPTGLGIGARAATWLWLWWGWGPQAGSTGLFTVNGVPCPDRDVSHVQFAHAVHASVESRTTKENTAPETSHARHGNNQEVEATQTECTFETDGPSSNKGRLYPSTKLVP
eukprot:CAMPEP_0172774396 /NCGR_PEP_ID=MMETSP1074-20121228/196074_1 /TAXON_ID=2916 /ORGANISM="Ceratium fusus, Strain PA161109" /LENGTH=130 /DNA_ID=CAMNT_0013610819 /DNA_START=130 /DNA_END=522 /DNA_ORIENTATION=+